MEKTSILSAQEFSDSKFTKRIVFRKGDSTVFILNFMPGQELPAHKHPGTEVYLLVLQGNGTFIIDGTETEVTEKDIIHTGATEELAFKNTGSEPASLYVMLNKIPDERFVQNI